MGCHKKGLDLEILNLFLCLFQTVQFLRYELKFKKTFSVGTSSNPIIMKQCSWILQQLLAASHQCSDLQPKSLNLGVNESLQYHQDLQPVQACSRVSLPIWQRSKQRSVTKWRSCARLPNLTRFTLVTGFNRLSAFCACQKLGNAVSTISGHKHISPKFVFFLSAYVFQSGSPRMIKY